VTRVALVFVSVVLGSLVHSGSWGYAARDAAPTWKKCPGTVAAAGRTFVVGVDGGVTCAKARRAIPPLQRTVASRLSTPGRVVYFAGPPGWKCLAVAEPPAHGRRELSGYCALGIKTFTDANPKAAFTWLTPFLASKRLG
jgi:hypothetical protein